MIEAEITCVCRHIELPDLELNLYRGDRVYILNEKAEASGDLDRAKRLGAVAVRPFKRYDDKRDTSKRGAPRARPLPARPRPQPALPNVQQIASSIPTGLTREGVAAEVEVQLALFEQRLVAALVKAQPHQVVHVQAAPAPVNSAKLPGTVQQDDTPVFIPSKLVDSEAKGDIKTKKSQSKGTGVEDAAAALKAAREKR